MLDCKEGRLLRQMKKEDAAMKIHILLCDDEIFCSGSQMPFPSSRCLREYRPV